MVVRLYPNSEPQYPKALYNKSHRFALKVKIVAQTCAEMTDISLLIKRLTREGKPLTIRLHNRPTFLSISLFRTIENFSSSMA